MSIMERCEWLHEQSDTDLRDIIVYHQRCFDGKQGNQKKKILIIDDEAAFTKLFKMTLELNAGYEVCVVNDPHLAVSTARKCLPDIVILDMVMPELDGPSVHKQFMADSALKNISIIFLSVIAATKEVGERTGLMDGSSYVAKPVSAKTLIGIIEEHFCSVVTEKSHDN